MVIGKYTTLTQSLYLADSPDAAAMGPLWIWGPVKEKTNNHQKRKIPSLKQNPRTLYKREEFI